MALPSLHVEPAASMPLLANGLAALDRADIAALLAANRLWWRGIAICPARPAGSPVVVASVILASTAARLVIAPLAVAALRPDTNDGALLIMT